MDAEEKLRQTAVEFVKKNKQEIIDMFAGSEFKPVEHPISVFMAGSPGAGKTEFSKELIKTFEQNESSEKIVRIDADEIRNLLPGYTGTNADVFQYPASLGVEKVHDYVLAAGKNFVLDATFSDFERAKSNVGRSLERGRNVDIYFIYQDPLLAWEITQKREALEGRRVPKEAFVRHLFGSLDSVRLLQKEFGKDITINVFTRDVKQDLYVVQLGVDDIDKCVTINYSKNQLLQVL